jgi:hypothetical protein
MNGLIDVKAQLAPVSKASGCAVFSLGAAAYVEEGLHMGFV